MPYNPYLLRLFNCHINVEACGSIKAVKYLFKYINKSHDRASVAMREADKEDSKGNVDEIKHVTPQCYGCTKTLASHEHVHYHLIHKHHAMMNVSFHVCFYFNCLVLC